MLFVRCMSILCSGDWSESAERLLLVSSLGLLKLLSLNLVGQYWVSSSSWKLFQLLVGRFAVGIIFGFMLKVCFISS